jgi:hypothetical protein
MMKLAIILLSHTLAGLTGTSEATFSLVKKGKEQRVANPPFWPDTMPLTFAE